MSWYVVLVGRVDRSRGREVGSQQGTNSATTAEVVGQNLTGWDRGCYTKRGRQSGGGEAEEEGV